MTRNKLILVSLDYNKLIIILFNLACNFNAWPFVFFIPATTTANDLRLRGISIPERASF